jgi:hypothetical protein
LPLVRVPCPLIADMFCDARRETNTAGTLAYPHAISLVVGSFSDIFGTNYGRQLQAWCIKWGWPLAWARGPYGHQNGGAPGRFLDPHVLAKSRAGQNLTVPASNKAWFDHMWDLTNSTYQTNGWPTAPTEPNMPMMTECILCATCRMHHPAE